jgi:phytoene synthase
MSELENTQMRHAVRPGVVDDELGRKCQAILSARARSFRWGQILLPKNTARDVAVCYAFCRMVDDTVDDATSKESAREGIDVVLDEVNGTRPRRPLVAAYVDLAHRRGIPESAAHELIAGMKSDLDDVRLADDKALLTYAYRAAGTVGIMMCGLLGVTAREALPHAIDLGIAMQLTNIARDVREDAAMNRVYIPESRLRAYGASHASVLDGSAKPSSTFPAVRDVLVLAERYYESADKGIAFIPWRARISVLIAARLYRSIGLRVLRRGPLALTSRTVVSPAEKVWRTLSVLVEWTVSAFRSPPIPRHEETLHHPLRGLPGVNPG